MPEEIMGYYTRRKDALLRGLDRTAALMKEPLTRRYGAEFSDILLREVRQEFSRLIPEIPYTKGGMRTRMFNSFLVVTAQELAVYRVMKRHSKSPAEAWELCHEALRLWLAEYPSWKRWVLQRAMFSSIVAKVFERRAKKNQRGHFGGFEVEYLVPADEDFDLGINYHRCGNLDFVRRHDGKEFAPFVCMSDIALSDALGWGLVRTQTLADGYAYCDFRFKKGAETKISSKTKEVQEAIEIIKAKEAEQVAAPDARSSRG